MEVIVSICRLCGCGCKVRGVGFRWLRTAFWWLQVFDSCVEMISGGRELRGGVFKVRGGCARGVEVDVRPWKVYGRVWRWVQVVGDVCKVCV